MGVRRPQESVRTLLLLAQTAGLFILVVVCTQIVAFQSLAEPADNRLKRVLILHAYNFTFPATTLVSNAARSKLLESHSAIQIEADFLDLARRPDDSHALKTANFLHEKYRSVRFDVILAIGIAAADFCAKYRDLFAPGVPVVFAGGNRAAAGAARFPSGITGVVPEISIKKILSLAKGLQPGARQVIVIAGSSDLDQPWHKLAREELKERETNLKITYWFDFEYKTLLSQLSQLPNDAIVILLTVYADRSGRPLIPRDVATQVAKTSNAPVYGPFETFLGTGIVGGHMETYDSLGASLGDMALKILDGADPNALPIGQNAGRFRVDSRSMNRWGLRKSDLPTDSVVLFEANSIWDTHRDLVILALAALCLQSLLVAGLLIQRRRRKKAENMLRESEERMTFTAASANIALWQLDRKSDEVWATEHCRSLFGIPAGKRLSPDVIIESIHHEDREIAVAGLRNAANGSAMADFRVVQSDGQIRWIRARARANPEHENSDLLSGLFVDITDQKAAEAEAAEQRQEVSHLMRVSVMGELSGAIAHEVNQPLTAILSNAQAALHMLGQKSPNLAELREAIQDIVLENNRASEVIKRLRGLLKKGERRFEAIDINDLIRSTISLLNSEMISRRVSVNAQLNDVPLVAGDIIQLQQVLLNLFMNAMDAMASIPYAERLITVSTRATPTGSVEIAIKDRGCGIPMRETGRAFEPFYTTKEHGLGLGLTICSTIVQAHGGQLSLGNNSDRGALARISLQAQVMPVAAK
jgi:C4-dicarboxylate-specific signal transduction histidine kinase/ABC-type uncharacterized transport system substrate-binding protein